MTNRVTEIAIHPFREDEENGWYNTGGEGKPDGWNVHTFAAGDDDDEDDDDEDLWVDEDFDDYDSP